MSDPVLGQVVASAAPVGSSVGPVSRHRRSRPRCESRSSGAAGLQRHHVPAGDVGRGPVRADDPGLLYCPLRRCHQRRTGGFVTRPAIRFAQLAVSRPSSHPPSRRRETATKERVVIRTGRVPWPPCSHVYITVLQGR